MTAVAPDSSAPGGKRRFSIAALLQFDVARSLSTTLQDDLTALLRGLCGYREELSDNQKREFNGEFDNCPIISCFFIVFMFYRFVGTGQQRSLHD
jgi:hypothetical protein